MHLKFCETALDERRRERIVCGKGYEEIACCPVRHLIERFLHPPVLIERHDFDAWIGELQHDRFEIICRAVVQNENFVHLARLRQHGCHGFRQETRVVVARNADRHFPIGGRQDERMLGTNDSQFLVGELDILRPDRIRAGGLVDGPSVRQDHADVLVEESAIKLVVRERPQPLVQAPKFVHDGLLHHEARAADRHAFKVHQRTQPRRARAVMRL